MRLVQPAPGGLALAEELSGVEARVRALAVVVEHVEVAV